MYLTYYCVINNYLEIIYLTYYCVINEGVSLLDKAKLFPIFHLNSNLLYSCYFIKICYSLKLFELKSLLNLFLASVFRGYRMGRVARNGSIYTCVNQHLAILKWKERINFQDLTNFWVLHYIFHL